MHSLKFLYEFKKARRICLDCGVVPKNKFATRCPRCRRRLRYLVKGKDGKLYACRENRIDQESVCFD